MTLSGTAVANVYYSDEIRFDPGPPRCFAPAGISTYAAMLGSGKPEPTPYRFGPGGAVVTNQTPYLVDAGEGIWRAIAKAALAHDGLLIDSLAPNKLTRLFLTHLHSDHTVGLPGLLLLPWTCGRQEPLEIFGPIGTERLVRLTLEAYWADVQERVHGPERKDDRGWRAVVHEIEAPGCVYADDNIRVDAFHHTHGGFQQNFGYRFVTADRTIVWAGDGVDNAAYRQAIEGADVLFSDIAPAVENTDAVPWRSNDTIDHEHRTIWHIRSEVLGRLAEAAGVKTLVVHHEQNYSVPYDVNALAKEAQRYFSGQVISARDGDVY